MSLTTFHPFRDLPTELRLKIWEFCLPPPKPRVVPVRFSGVSKRYITTHPPSPLLSTTPESRTLYLTHTTHLLLSPSYASNIRINFPLDTLLFDSLSCSPGGDLALDLSLSPHRNLIQRIAFSVQLWDVLRTFRVELLSEVRVLGGVRSVGIVVLQGGEGKEGDGNGIGIGIGNEGERERESGERVQDLIGYCLGCVEGVREAIERVDNAGEDRNGGVGDGVGGHGKQVVWRNGKPEVRLCLW